MFRKYVAKKPCEVMDKLQNAFTHRFKDLLGDDITGVKWERNFESARQLMEWAIGSCDVDFDVDDMRVLNFLLENAMALEKEKNETHHF